MHLRQTAKQVMETDIKFLPTRTTIGRIVDLLSEVKFQAIPVVDDEKNLQFLGCVTRKHLVDFVYRRFYERHGEVRPQRWLHFRKGSRSFTQTP